MHVQTSERPNFSFRYLRPFIYLNISVAGFVCFLIFTQGDNNYKEVDVVEKAALSIHFVETSSKEYLRAREACCVESAAYYHPETEVVLHSTGELSLNDSYVTLLSSISNIRLKRLELSQLFEGTPLEQWHSQGLIESSSYPVQHLSDAVRLALLWKEGGVYLDTDVIVLRSFHGLSNALALENQTVANGAILVFDKNDDFLTQCLSDYVGRYDGSVWGDQGPLLVTRNLKEVCHTKDLRKVVNDPSACRGVTLLTSQAFYPIHWRNWTTFFGPADQVNFNLSNTYTVHLWGKLSSDTPATPGNNSLIEELVSDNCPLVYQMMKLNNTI